MNLGGDANASPFVYVTQHVGVESDRWLLHELDSAFRDKFGIPHVSYYPWQIEGNTILIDAIGEREYRWVSGNKVVMIEYRGSLSSTPEPFDVVRAYLSKHPSTIPTMTLSQLRSSEGKATWIKEEMERRLWLADKWFAQIQPAEPKLRDKLKSMTDYMVVFLDYREKYYRIASKSDKIAFEAALFEYNASAARSKLTEYKTWWMKNKENTITL